MFTAKKKPGRKVSNKENFDNCNRENQEFIVKGKCEVKYNVHFLLIASRGYKIIRVLDEQKE